MFGGNKFYKFQQLTTSINNLNIMEIKITAKQMELTEAMKEYVETRIHRLDKFENNFTLVDVHLFSEKHEKKITANVKGTKKTLFSEAHDTSNLYKAIDACVDKLEKQIRRGKQDHDHTPLNVEKAPS